MDLPKQVLITEVGPRDGLQQERQQVPTQEKVALIAGLAKTGLPAIQVASFVHPKRVPQMADAEAVIEQLPQGVDVQFSALALNAKGVERALQTAIPWIEISIAASDHQSRTNAGLPLDLIPAEVEKMMTAALSGGRKVRASIQCTFGCADQEVIAVDKVLELADLLLAQGVHHLVLADTTGMATPLTIKNILKSVIPMAGAVSVGLHLHDTRGIGLVNLMAGLEMGVSCFDTSLGGLGGCPFVPGAAGNIATEDTLYLLKTLNIDTGVNIAAVAQWSHRLSRLFGRTLPGKIYRLNSSSSDNAV